MILNQFAIISVLKNIKFGAGSKAKHTGCYSRGPEIGSEHPYGSSQLSM